MQCRYKCFKENVFSFFHRVSVLTELMPSVSIRCRLETKLSYLPRMVSVRFFCGVGAVHIVGAIKGVIPRGVSLIFCDQPHPSRDSLPSSRVMASYPLPSAASAKPCRFALCVRTTALPLTPNTYSLYFRHHLLLSNGSE